MIFGLGCAEEAILLCGEGVSRVAKAIEEVDKAIEEVDKAIEYLEVEARQKRGSGKCACARLVLKMMSSARVSAEDPSIHNLLSTDPGKQFEPNLHLYVKSPDFTFQPFRTLYLEWLKNSQEMFDTLVLTPFPIILYGRWQGLALVWQRSEGAEY